MDAEWLCIGQKQCMRTFRWCFISLFRQKRYNTWCSQAVSHPSTNQALRCLTSVIGREPVHSTWYGRSHWYLKQNALVLENSFIQHCFTHLAIFFHFFRCILMMIFLRLLDPRSEHWAADRFRSLHFQKEVAINKLILNDNNLFLVL